MAAQQQIDKLACALAEHIGGTKAYDYRTVDVSTLSGVRTAERMQADGWRIVRPGMFTIVMERELDR